MASIYDWSTTAGSNGNSDSAIDFQEGQAPSTLNNSARALMGRLAEFRSDLSGAIAAAGTANGLTVLANSAFTTLVDGRIVSFRATADNTGAATLNVNSIGAKAIRKMTASGDAALIAGEIQDTGIYVAQYSEALNGAAGAWLLINPTTDFSSFITLTGTQTLTNKTLTSPTINTPTIATPTITNGSASGMALTGGSWTGGTDLAIADGGTGASTAAAAFTALKQAATEAATGVVELATTAEASTGTDTTRAVTPAGVLAAVPIRTAALAVGAVGTYAMLRRVTGVANDPGDEVAGADLAYTSGANQIGASPSGTWRLMGATTNTGDGVRSMWLRLS